MLKTHFPVILILVLALLLVVSCGIPKEDYEAVVSDRDSAQAELQSVKNKLNTAETELETVQSELNTVKSELQSVKNKLNTAETELETVQNELNTVKSELQSTQSDLSQITSLASSLASKLDLTEQVLASESARYRYIRAGKEGNEEEKKRQGLLGLSAFKLYDWLVENVGDTELSRLWGETWPEGARQESEEEQMPNYVFKAYARFLDRLWTLIETDVNEVKTLLAE